MFLKTFEEIANAITIFIHIWSKKVKEVDLANMMSPIGVDYSFEAFGILDIAILFCFFGPVIQSSHVLNHA